MQGPDTTGRQTSPTTARIARHDFHVRVPREAVPILTRALGPAARRFGGTVSSLLHQIAADLQEVYNCEVAPEAWLPHDPNPHHAFGPIVLQTFHGVQFGYCVNRSAELITLVGARDDPPSDE